MSKSEISGLVHRLHSMLPSLRTVAFIAARSGEGTSTVARDFAVGLAEETDRKVLIIDAGALDRERFTTDGINPVHGLVETVITHQPPDKVAHKIDYNVWLARWVGQESNRGGAIRLLRDRNFWQSLHENFDIVVIDAPALQSSGDGIALAAQADAAILVIEAEMTRQPVIENLRDALAAAGAKIAGSVMNKRRLYIPEKVYARL